jgi:hypothetical protein
MPDYWLEFSLASYVRRCGLFPWRGVRTGRGPTEPKHYPRQVSPSLPRGSRPPPVLTRFRLGLGDSGSGSLAPLPTDKTRIRIPLPRQSGRGAAAGRFKGIGSGLLSPPGPSRDQLGHIVLSRLSSGQIDRGKDIFQPGLSGIKTYGEKVLPGIIGYCRDTSKGGDGGAHGVGAAASHQRSLLHQARDPEIYAPVVHDESSVRPGHPALSHHPARPVLLMG